MYLKIKEEVLKGWPRTTVKRFEVLQSYRDPITREPRNKYIGYLGSFRMHKISDELARLCFWECVTIRLSRLPLSPDEVNHISNEILKHIPRPVSAEEVLTAALARNHAEATHP